MSLKLEALLASAQNESKRVTENEPSFGVNEVCASVILRDYIIYPRCCGSHKKKELSNSQTRREEADALLDDGEKQSVDVLRVDVKEMIGLFDLFDVTRLKIFLSEPENILKASDVGRYLI